MFASLNKLLFDVVNASVTLDVDLFHRYRLTQDEILKALNAAMKGVDLPFEAAKKACTEVAKNCKNFIAKVAAYPVCQLVKTPPAELNAPPQIAQEILAGKDADAPNVINANASANPTQGGTAPSASDMIEAKLPMWCFIRDAHHAFEVTPDYSIRGLTTAFDGSAQLQKNGTITWHRGTLILGSCSCGTRKRLLERLS